MGGGELWKRSSYSAGSKDRSNGSKSESDASDSGRREKIESVELDKRVDSEAKVMESESEDWKCMVALERKESDDEEESNSIGG